MRHIILDDDSVLVLETGNTGFIREYCSYYTNADDYFAINISKEQRYGVIMQMSNSKIRRALRHLTNEIRKAKHFNLSVFGKLREYGGGIYGVSPLAIW